MGKIKGKMEKRGKRKDCIRAGT